MVGVRGLVLEERTAEPAGGPVEVGVGDGDALGVGAGRGGELVEPVTSGVGGIAIGGDVLEVRVVGILAGVVAVGHADHPLWL